MSWDESFMAGHLALANMLPTIEPARDSISSTRVRALQEKALSRRVLSITVKVAC